MWLQKNKTKFLMIVFSISIVCKHTWFINYWGSQHLNFQVFSTFENFALDQKYILETILSLMCVGNALLPSSFQMGFPIALEMYYIFQSWQRNYYQLISYYSNTSRWNLKPLNIGWNLMTQTRWLLKFSKKKYYTSWLEWFNPWLQIEALNQKRTIYGIKNLDMSLCKV